LSVLSDVGYGFEPREGIAESRGFCRAPGGFVGRPGSEERRQGGLLRGGLTLDAAGEDPITLQLRPLPSDRPLAIRLRRVLKELLRREQLRCVRIAGEALPPDLAALVANEEVRRRSPARRRWTVADEVVSWTAWPREVHGVRLTRWPLTPAS
jgi:hypothetical protein